MTEEQEVVKSAKPKRKDLLSKIEQLEKDLKSKQGSYDYVNGQRSSLEKEINELHATFDAVGVPRKVESVDQWSGDMSLSLQARFTNYLQRMIVPQKFEASTKHEIG